MNIKHLFTFALLLTCLPALTLYASGKDITIRSATLPDNKNHEYYIELLTKSLKLIGYNSKIILSKDIPQQRVAHMLDKGEIDIYYFIESKKRNKRWISAGIGLTNNLIGHRILFIPEKSQQIYDSVKTLKDFRKLNKVGAFGENWFDIDVWKHNSLRYKVVEHDWNHAFQMVASKQRGLDYFSRSSIEIWGESKKHPYLDIESKLLFVYERDYQFYMSKKFSGKYRTVISKALKKAKNTGLIDRLIDKHWGDHLKKLNFKKRLQIILKNP